GQVAVTPGDAAVVRRGEAGVDRAAVGEAALLERGDDDAGVERADGDVGLDLGVGLGSGLGRRCVPRDAADARDGLVLVAAVADSRRPLANGAGMRLVPRTKLDRRGRTGPAGSMPGRRRSSTSNMTRRPRRARLAPRQKCGPPPPKATCSFGVRPMSKRYGSS